jgi:hypothetical protein
VVVEVMPRIVDRLTFSQLAQGTDCKIPCRWYLNIWGDLFFELHESNGNGMGYPVN